MAKARWRAMTATTAAYIFWLVDDISKLVSKYLDRKKDTTGKKIIKMQ